MVYYNCHPFSSTSTIMQSSVSPTMVKKRKVKTDLELRRSNNICFKDVEQVGDQKKEFLSGGGGISSSCSYMMTTKNNNYNNETSLLLLSSPKRQSQPIIFSSINRKQFLFQKIKFFENQKTIPILLIVACVITILIAGYTSQTLQIINNKSSQLRIKADTANTLTSSATTIKRKRNMITKEYKSGPRIIGWYFTGTKSTTMMGVGKVTSFYAMQSRSFEGELPTAKPEEVIDPSKAKWMGGILEPDNPECTAQYKWQDMTYPTCNSVFEIDLLSTLHLDTKYPKIIANGFFRDTWTHETTMNQDKVAIKALRLQHEFRPEYYERHRRDATAMGHLKQYPHVIDIYSFCGNTGIYEYANGGTLEDVISQKFHSYSTKEKLIIAHQVATGLANVHNSEQNGMVTMAHNDAKISQFVYVSNQQIFKINDFNSCFMIYHNQRTNEECSFKVLSSYGPLYAPEIYSSNRVTAKVDTFSLGNVFFTMLFGRIPFQEHDPNWKPVQIQISNGERDKLPDLNTVDEYSKALIQAIQACWIHDATERISAQDLAKFIEKQLNDLDVKERTVKQLLFN